MFLRGNRRGTFVVWDTARLIDEFGNAYALQDDLIIARAAAVSDDVLLVMNRPLDPKLVARHQGEVLGEFTESIVPDERFYLYRLRGEGSGDAAHKE